MFSMAMLWLTYFSGNNTGITMCELEIIGKFALWGQIGQPFKQSQFYYDGLVSHHEDSLLFAQRLMECQIEIRQQYDKLSQDAKKIIDKINQQYDYYKRNTFKEDLLCVIMAVSSSLAILAL